MDREQKSIILGDVFDFIYSASNKRFKDRLEALISKNTAMQGGDLIFIYKGEHYSGEGVRRTVRKTNSLHPLLKELMDEWIAEKIAMKDEQSLVKAFLASVLNSSNNVSDYYRLLPECLHKALRPFKHLPDFNEPIPDWIVTEFQEKNQRAINLIKQRFVLNLIV